jgi:polyisoprenoid-binding protein YceI
MGWNVDFAHSQIQVAIRHMMISNVKGHFDKFEVDAQINEAHPEESQVDVKIQAASINTKMEQRDAHLRSADFLDAEKYPYIAFKTTRNEIIDDAHGKIHGDLTIKDVTRPVVLNVEYQGQSKSPWGTINAGFTAHAKFNRKDWGLNWNAALETGGWLVGDDIKVEIDIEFVKTPETVPQAAAVA